MTIITTRPAAVTAEPDFPAASAIPAVRDMGEAVNSEWRMNIAAFSVNKKQKTADRLSFLCKKHNKNLIIR